MESSNQTPKIIHAFVLGSKGRITIAYKREGDVFIRCGFAFCSPKDNFSRQRGRSVALGRLEHSNSNITMVAVDMTPADEGNANNAGRVVKAVMGTVSDLGYLFPRWARGKILLTRHERALMEKNLVF
jgi:hypothetical protein